MFKKVRRRNRIRRLEKILANNGIYYAYEGCYMLELEPTRLIIYGGRIIETMILKARKGIVHINLKFLEPPTPPLTLSLVYDRKEVIEYSDQKERDALLKRVLGLLKNY